jgi:hypothetical protein
MNHDDDATSVAMMVQKLRLENYDPILIYMPYMKMIPGLDMLKGSFILGIQTEQQKVMYEKFGNNIICIDSTHKTNYYNYKLITVMVVDEYHKGYPIAFGVGSSDDELMYSYLIKSIKEKSPNVQPQILMIDDDQAIVNGMESVFGCTFRHILCTWHVQRNWRQHIRQVHKGNIYIHLYLNDMQRYNCF